MPSGEGPPPPSPSTLEVPSRALRPVPPCIAPTSLPAGAEVELDAETVIVSVQEAAAEAEEAPLLRATPSEAFP